MTTVAILSDTHSYLSPKVAKIISQCDYAVHAGDIGCRDVLRHMQPRKKKIIAVRGNNDSPAHWAEEEVRALSALGHVAELELPGGTLVVEHGHRHGMHMPDHYKLRKAHPYARLIVYGHSHKIVQDLNEKPWVVNPGAAGKTRTHGGPTCIVLKATPKEWTLEEHRFAE
jgi:putative phosphoesterase